MTGSLELWRPDRLWTPRAGPWWRLPALFSGKFQRGSDGKLRRGSDGKNKTHDPSSPSPCCCAAVTACCISGDIPSTWTLVASGISSPCPCEPGPFVGDSRIAIGSPNGTFTAALSTQTEGNCSWGAAVPTSQYKTVLYTSGDCTTGGTDDPAYSWLVIVQRGFGGGTMTAQVLLSNAFACNPTGFLDCGNTVVLTNTLTDCSSPNSVYGGTVTLTPHP